MPLRTCAKITRAWRKFRIGILFRERNRKERIEYGSNHVDPILIKRIPRQGIVGIAIQLIGLKRMGRMLEYKNKQLYNKEE